MNNRAVTYARVSGDDRVKDGRNLAGQLDICRDHALKKGYLIVAELSEDDRGASGASFELPALNQALEMAKNGEFDILVVREIDRFARSLAKQLIIEQEFRRHRVQIEYVMGEYPDTPEGSLNKNIKAVIAEYERLKINERMIRGRRQKIKAGNVIVHGKAPYGYRLEEVDGKSKLLVNEDEAQIVRIIYQWYVFGEDKKGPMSARVIARRLTQMGVPIPPLSNRNSTKWSRTTVGRIVSSKTYIGVWHYGKNGRSNGHRFNNPEEYWLSVEVPAIVDMDLWDAAQERKSINVASAKKNLKYQYLMNRRLICGVCGSKIAACGSNDGYKNRLYYRCNVARGYDEYERKCDNARYFKAEDVDFTIWEWLKSFIRDPDAIDDGIAEYHEHREREQAPFLERLQVVDDLLIDHRNQLQKLLDIYLDGNFPKELLVERRQRLQDTVDSLAAERVNLISHLENSAHSPEQLQAIKETAFQVAAGLDEAEEDFDSRKYIVEMLNVYARLVIEEEEKIAYVTCVFKEEAERLLIVSPNTYNNAAFNWAELNINLMEAEEDAKDVVNAMRSLLRSIYQSGPETEDMYTSIGKQLQQNLDPLTRVTTSYDERLANYFDTWAWILFRMGGVEKIREAYDLLSNSAILLAPGLPMIHYHIARVCLSKVEMAIQTLQNKNRQSKKLNSEMIAAITHNLRSASIHIRHTNQMDRKNNFSTQTRLLREKADYYSNIWRDFHISTIKK